VTLRCNVGQSWLGPSLGPVDLRCVAVWKSLSSSQHMPAFDAAHAEQRVAAREAAPVSAAGQGRISS
jgi:hypothetical protein